MNGYYLKVYYHLQNGINWCHHGSTSIGAHDWPLMSLSTDNVPMDNVPGVPPPADNPDVKTTNPQEPDQSCTPDRTYSRAHRLVVGAQNGATNAYDEATALDTKQCKYSD